MLRPALQLPIHWKHTLEERLEFVAVLQSICDVFVFISSSRHTPGLCHKLAQKSLQPLTNASTTIMNHLSTDSTAAWADSEDHTTLLWTDIYIGLLALSEPLCSLSSPTRRPLSSVSSLCCICFQRPPCTKVEPFNPDQLLPDDSELESDVGELTQALTTQIMAHGTALH